MRGKIKLWLIFQDSHLFELFGCYLSFEDGTPGLDGVYWESQVRHLQFCMKEQQYVNHNQIEYKW